MNRYPYLLTTVILGGLLIPPFLLKIFSASLEPYPAVILPAGAHQVELTDSRIKFSRTSFWGKNLATNSWTKIDSEQLLEPIPNSYLGHMVNNSFGLETTKKDVGSKLKQMFVRILRSKVTPEEIMASKTWLGEKLVQQDSDPTWLRVTEEEIIFDVSTGKVISNRIEDEKVFRLD